MITNAQNEAKRSQVRWGVLVIALAVTLMFAGCSVWRLRTPKFNTGPQTNSIGEIYYPPK